MELKHHIIHVSLICLSLENLCSKMKMLKAFSKQQTDKLEIISIHNINTVHKLRYMSLHTRILKSNIFFKLSDATYVSFRIDFQSL